jgi:hypothetical protein
MSIRMMTPYRRYRVGLSSVTDAHGPVSRANCGYSSPLARAACVVRVVAVAAMDRGTPVLRLRRGDPRSAIVPTLQPDDRESGHAGQQYIAR